MVMFEDAVLHLTRLKRVLEMRRGNMVLIGLGGSGK
jgi:dynein heavy chain